MPRSAALASGYTPGGRHDMVRAGIVQFDPRLADTGRNLDVIEQEMAQAASHGVELAVFPECSVTGYVFHSLDEAMAVAEPIPGPSSERIAAVAARQGLFAIIGMLERCGERLFNSAILVGPRGLEATYRKTHTLCLGVDRFTTPGDIPYRVLDLPIGRLGILICYDQRFPEPARALALLGAQIIALPTNWPVSSTIQPDVFTRSRAAENRVFLLAADRVGCERGTRFLGRSQVVAPDGTVLCEASPDEPEMLVADLDLAEADRKHVVVAPGEHEMDAVADRRPDLYGALVAEQQPAEVR